MSTSERSKQWETVKIVAAVVSMAATVASFGLAAFASLPPPTRWGLIAAGVIIPIPLALMAGHVAKWRAQGWSLVLVAMVSFAVGAFAGFSMSTALSEEPPTSAARFAQPSGPSPTPPTTTVGIVTTTAPTLLPNSRVWRGPESLGLSKGSGVDLDTKSPAWGRGGPKDKWDMYLNFGGGWIQGWRDRNGTGTDVVLVNTGPSTRSMCDAALKTGGPKHILPEYLVKGARLCVLTGEDRLALLKITKRSPSAIPQDITFEAIVWQK